MIDPPAGLRKRRPEHPAVAAVKTKPSRELPFHARITISTGVVPVCGMIAWSSSDATRGSPQVRVRRQATFANPATLRRPGSPCTLAVAFHYRRDEHNEAQVSRPTSPLRTVEPNQRSVERTWSAAVENRLALTPALRLTLGGSFDWRDLDRAEEFGVPQGTTGAARLYS